MLADRMMMGLEHGEEPMELRNGAIPPATEFQDYISQIPDRINRYQPPARPF